MSVLKYLAMFMLIAGLAAGTGYLGYKSAPEPEPIVVTKTVLVDKIVDRIVEKQIEVTKTYKNLMGAIIFTDGNLVQFNSQAELNKLMKIIEDDDTLEIAHIFKCKYNFGGNYSVHAFFFETKEGPVKITVEIESSDWAVETETFYVPEPNSDKEDEF